LGPGLTPDSREYLCNGVFADVKGGILTHVALIWFATRYRPDDWTSVGPKLITEVARYLEKGKFGTYELMKTFDFLPIHWSQAPLLTAPLANVTPDQLFAVSHAVQLHVYGGAYLFNLTRDAPGGEQRNVLGTAMMNRCPLTYCAARMSGEGDQGPGVGTGTGAAGGGAKDNVVTGH
jgi:hypothetical protein